MALLEGTEVSDARFSFKHTVERCDGQGGHSERSKREMTSSFGVVGVGFNIRPWHSHCLGLVFLTWLCIRIKKYPVPEGSNVDGLVG